MQQLRLVSVLFMDIVGSTAMSSKLDPEDISEVIDGLLRRCTAIVAAHGGRVLQYAGDNLLAAFGADAVREDDAQRSVHAGLALLAEGRASGQVVQQRFGHAGMNVRVGAHTGAVLLGSGVDGDNSIRGLAVNTAARLEQTAPAGSLHISHETWRHVQGLFEVERRAPQAMKGIDAPPPSYLVLGSSVSARRGAHAARGVEGVATPCLGRDDELALLRAALEQAGVQGSALGITVLADAGLGKSRLVDELLAGLAAASPRLTGQAHRDKQGQPYALLRDMLAGWLRIADGDSADSARQAWVQGLAPLLGAQGEASAQLIGQLVGIDFAGSPHLAGAEGRALRDRALSALGDLLQALATQAGAPVLLIADDLHWADEASLELLLHLMQSALPLLVLGLARPALLERRANWGEGVATHRAVALEALGGEHSQALAAALLQHLPDAPAALTELLLRNAAGNPYYMEELLKMLIDDGVIAVAHDTDDSMQWQLDQTRLAQARVPTTLTGVLQARLDALAAPEKRALQQASIVGSVFWDDALAALDADAPAALPGLQCKALVQPQDGSSFEGTREKTFRHHLLHQVTYDTVLKAERRAGHAAAAQWLAARVGGRKGEHLATTARHFLQAGDTVQAVAWLADAVEHANKRFDGLTALALADQALALVAPEDIVLAYRIHRAAAVAAVVVARPARQNAAVSAMEALARQPDAPTHWRASVGVSRASYCFRTGRIAEGLAAATDAATSAEAIGHAWLTAEAHNLRLILSRLLGDLTTARAAGVAGLAVADQAADPATPLRLRINLGTVETSLSHHESARQMMAGALATVPEGSDPQVLLPLLINLGDCELQLGDMQAGAAAAQRALTLGTQIGDGMHAAIARGTLAMAMLMQGHAAAALAPTLQALEEVAALGGAAVLAELRWAAADVLAALGRHDEALAQLDLSCSYFEAQGMHDEALHTAGRQAQIELERGQPAAALQRIEPVLARLADVGADHPLARSMRLRWACHNVLAALHDPRAEAHGGAARALAEETAASIGDEARRQRFVRQHPLARVLLGT